MAAMSFIAAAGADASATEKPPISSSTAATAPTILCMDSSLEMQALPLHDQMDATDLLEHLPQQRALPARGQQPQQQWQQQWQQQGQQPLNACSTAPPPSSIFVPPSAVPACECCHCKPASCMQRENSSAVHSSLTAACCSLHAVG
jgi:hypothetical protein